MPTKFSRRMAEKSVTITSRRSDRSFGIFFGRFISSFRISVIVRETKIGIVWLQAVSAKEKRTSETEAPSKLPLERSRIGCVEHLTRSSGPEVTELGAK